jgi:hypothetical protein
VFEVERVEDVGEEIFHDVERGRAEGIVHVHRDVFVRCELGDEVIDLRGTSAEAWYQVWERGTYLGLNDVFEFYNSPLREERSQDIMACFHLSTID